MVGLLKKDVKRIRRGVQKSVAMYLPKSTAFVVDVRTPQTTLLTNGDHAKDRGISFQLGS